jgi:hypothetical protein
MDAPIADLVAVVLALTAALAYVNVRWLRLPSAIGLLLTALLGGQVKIGKFLTDQLLCIFQRYHPVHVGVTKSFVERLVSSPMRVVQHTLIPHRR